MPKTETSPEPETGPAVIDKMTLERSLDRFFQTNPGQLTDADYVEFVATQRKLRALWIEKKGE
jgi:hypothetical protein